MTATILIGSQWGDEGKGKIIDYISPHYDCIVRFNGGSNSGHTIYHNNQKYIFRLVPSGIFNQNVICVLGQGMAMDPLVLAEEIWALKEANVKLENRLFISGDAHVIMPYHKEVDSCAQLNNKIGTTKKGVGPCYEDKAARRGIRVKDLLAPGLSIKLADTIAAWKHVIFDGPDEAVLPSKIEESIVKARVAFAQHVHSDVPLLLNDLMDTGKKVLLEGAQGTLLDVDHGTYPYVTSSNTVAGNACTGAGIGPTRVDQVIGVMKAYITRVGAGPFPTKITGELEQRLRDSGNEYGSVTKRPRDVGWLSIPDLLKAKRINGLTSLAVTKLDVLSGLKELFIHTSNVGDELVYQAFEGWEDDISNVRHFNDLPDNAKRYLDFISDATYLPIEYISVGPHKDETFRRFNKRERFNQIIEQKREEMRQED